MVRLDELPPELLHRVCLLLAGADKADLRAVAVVATCFVEPARCAMVEEITLRSWRGLIYLNQRLRARPDLASRVRRVACDPSSDSGCSANVGALIGLVPRCSALRVNGQPQSVSASLLAGVETYGRLLQSLDVESADFDVSDAAWRIVRQSRETLRTLRSCNWPLPHGGLDEFELPRLVHFEFRAPDPRARPSFKWIVTRSPALRSVVAPPHRLPFLPIPIIANMRSIVTHDGTADTGALAAEISRYVRLAVLALDIDDDDNAEDLLSAVPASVIDLDLQDSRIQLWRLIRLVMDKTWLPRLWRICLPRSGAVGTASWEAGELRAACERRGLESYVSTRG